MDDYRTRIYKEYASCMQDGLKKFNESEAIHWGKAYNRYFRNWLPQKPEADILDVACGGGRLLYFFKTRGYKNLLGIDISPQQVALSKEVTDQVKEIDIFEFLSSNTKKFDLITGLDIVEHFKKDEVIKFLEACYNSLTPHGRLILQTPNAQSPWGASIRYGDFTHEVAFDPSCLKRLLAFVGFSKIESREADPYTHGILSLGRFLLWKIIWGILAFWCLVETGGIGSGIFTRVFLISGVKTK